MMKVLFRQALVLLLLMTNGFSTPVVEYDKASKYEEYEIEHEISMMHAKNSVLSMDIDSIVIPPGCHTCTEQEKHYCLGRSLINDHCCCDKRYHEMFPFIPHTCYLGSQLCTTVLSNCEEYYRLRTCCCQKLALMKWKMKSNSRSIMKEGTSIMAPLILLNYFMYRYFT
nr:uncharacterized protein LOC111511058 [Leptinotarsa decemlineata]